MKLLSQKSIQSLLIFILFSLPLWSWAQQTGASTLENQPIEATIIIEDAPLPAVDLNEKPTIKDYGVTDEEKIYVVKWRTDVQYPMYFKMRGRSVVVFDDIRIFMLTYESGGDEVKYVAALPKNAEANEGDTLFNTYKPWLDRVTIYRYGYKYKLGNLTKEKFRIVKYPPSGKLVHIQTEATYGESDFDYIVEDFHLLRFTSNEDARAYFFFEENKVELLDYTGQGAGLAFDLIYRFLPPTETQLLVFMTSQPFSDQYYTAIQNYFAKDRTNRKKAVWIHLWKNGNAGVAIR